MICILLKEYIKLNELLDMLWKQFIIIIIIITCFLSSLRSPCSQKKTHSVYHNPNFTPKYPRANNTGDNIHDKRLQSWQLRKGGRI